MINQGDNANKQIKELREQNRLKYGLEKSKKAEKKVLEEKAVRCIMTKEQILNPKNNLSTAEKIEKLTKLYEALETQLVILRS